jgi:RNA polymerase sigma factor (sigma-70 family)
MEDQRSSLLLQEFLGRPKNRDLFGRFAARYYPRILECGLRHGLQVADAEDLAADLLLRFCERDVFVGFTFHTKAQFYAWLHKTVANAVLTFLRSRSRKPDAWSLGNAEAQESLQRVGEDVESLYAEVGDRIEKARAAAKARVEAKTWQVFELAMDECRKVDEITRELAMSKVAVWQALSRVKRMLREELRDLHEPDECD